MSERGGFDERQRGKRFDRFHGVIPALLTPFTSGGAALWPELIAPHLGWLAANGADGALILGTNGEGPSLSLAEKHEVVAAACAARPPGLFFLAGTATSSLPEAAAFGRAALAAGVDALLVLPPFYYKSPPGILAWYSALFSQLPESPLFLYNIPQFSGIEISLDLVAELDARFPTRLAGVKDSSGRPESVAAYARRFPHLTVLAGSDATIAASLGAGAAGALTSCGNIVPERVAAVVAACRAGSDAEPAQARLRAVRALMDRFSMYALNKYVLHKRIGLPVSAVRPPLSDLDAGERAAVDAALADLGL